MLSDVMNLIVCGCYVVSTITYIVYLFGQKEWIQNAGYALMMTGFAGHTVVMVLNYIELGHMPVHNMKETLSLCSWSLALVFLLMRYRFNVKIMGVYAAPLVLCVFLASMNTPEIPSETVDVFKSIWLVIHVVAIFIGEAALAMAFGVSVLYLIQEHAIKSKKRGFFYKRLPSLELLDTTGYFCIVTGFTVFTVGLVAGLIYAKLVWHRFADWDPKEVWAGISWLVYAALLHERIAVGWRGRRSAIMAIAGFAILLFTFFGVNFLMEGHHGTFTKW